MKKHKEKHQDSGKRKKGKKQPVLPSAQDEKSKATLPRNQARELRALQDTIYVLGGKWKLPIMNSICNGNKRFREIERSIPGITTRMLSRELRLMELNKLIKRKVDPGPPLLIEYESTDYCLSFGPVILSMIDWGIAHGKKIREK